MNMYWPKRFESDSVLNWAKCVGVYFLFFLSSIMWPYYTSFLKHILTFTAIGYQFSWNTDNLEIYQFESNQLLASSF